MVSESYSEAPEFVTPQFDGISRFGSDECGDLSYYSVIEPTSSKSLSQTRGRPSNDDYGSEATIFRSFKPKECKFKHQNSSVSKIYELKSLLKPNIVISLSQSEDSHAPPYGTMKTTNEITNGPNQSANSVLGATNSEIELKYPLASSLCNIIDNKLQTVTQINPLSVPGIHESSCATDSSTDTHTVKPCELQRRYGLWETNESSELSGNEQEMSFSELLANKMGTWCTIPKTRSDTQTDVCVLADCENTNAKIEQTIIEMDIDFETETQGAHLFDFENSDTEETLSLIRNNERKVASSGRPFELQLKNENNILLNCDRRPVIKPGINEQTLSTIRQKNNVNMKYNLDLHNENAILMDTFSRKMPEGTLRNRISNIYKHTARSMLSSNEDRTIHKAEVKKNVPCTASVCQVKPHKAPRPTHNINWAENTENMSKEMLNQKEQLTLLKDNALYVSNLSLLTCKSTFNSYSEMFDQEELKRQPEVSKIIGSAQSRDDKNIVSSKPNTGAIYDYRETNRTSAGSSSTRSTLQAPSEAFFAHLRKNHMSRTMMNQDVITMRPHFCRGKKIYF